MKRYKDDFDNCVNYMKNIKTWYKLIPNLLTVSRPLGMIPVNILFFTGNIVPAVVLTGCLLLTDLFDGKLARKWEVTSKLGADLDAVGDKIMFLGLALPLLVNVPGLAINFLLEAGIAGVNVFGRLNNLDTKTVYAGKVKTWFLSLTLLSGYLVQFFNIPKMIFNVLMLITSFFQGYALSDYISNYRKMEFDKKKDINLEEKEDNEFFEREKVKEKTDLIEELVKEKNFYLSSVQPGKVYSGKKRIRVLAHETKHNH